LVGVDGEVLSKSETQEPQACIFIGFNKKSNPDGIRVRDIDATKDADKFKIAFAKLNEEAYAELIMSINTNTMAGMIAFRIVASTKTTVRCWFC
jgi:hypothetical protein